MSGRPKSDVEVLARDLAKLRDLRIKRSKEVEQIDQKIIDTHARLTEAVGQPLPGAA